MRVPASSSPAYGIKSRPLQCCAPTQSSWTADIMSPWTAAEASSDAVSKKMILAHLQENSSAEFLSEHKLTGQANSVLKRVTKDAMVEAYKVSLGEGGAKKGGFSFAPPAAAKAGAEAAFTFSPPAADKAAAGGKPAAGNLFGKAPPAGGPGGGSGFAFNFGSPSKGGDDDEDDDDDDDDDYQTAKGMKQDIGKALQRRMEQLNMSAAQRRDQTMAELPPVRTAPRTSPRRVAPARATSACCRSSTPRHHLRDHLRIASAPICAPTCAPTCAPPSVRTPHPAASQAVRERVVQLEKLQESTDTLQKEFEAKLKALQLEYEGKYAPLYRERSVVVKGARSLSQPTRAQPVAICRARPSSRAAAVRGRGCSLACMGLQPPTHTAAASQIRLQPPHVG